MQFVEVDGTKLYYRTSGLLGGPMLLLSNSLGKTHRMWLPQIAAFEQRYRVITYDARGHGQSDAPKGPYSMGMLADDAAAILDAAGVTRTHWCGVSIGGMTGLAFAIHHPDRIDRLVVSNTAAYAGGREPWAARAAKVREDGMASLLPGALERWVTPAFRAKHPPILDVLIADFLANDVEGYVGNCQAVGDMDLRSELALIRAPALIIVGSDDAAATPADGDFLEANIPGARRVTLSASHVANIEVPDVFADAVIDFLA